MGLTVKKAIIYLGVFLLLLRLFFICSGYVQERKEYVIGLYKVQGADWGETLEFVREEQADSRKDIIRVFSELYPELTASKNICYIIDITFAGKTAVVHYGGDPEEISNRSGSTGAYLHEAVVVYALTHDPKIKKVELGLPLGWHYEPRAAQRGNFKGLWSNDVLEKAADEGDEAAKIILQNRRMP